MELILRNNIGDLLVIVKDIDKYDWNKAYAMSDLAEHIVEMVETEKEKR